MVAAAAFVVVVAGIRAAETVLVPFLLSIFLAVVCAAPMFWLQKKGVPVAIALLLVVLGILVAGLLISAFVGSSIDDFSKALPLYQARLQEKQTAFLAFLSRTGVDISSYINLDIFDPRAAMKLVARILSSVGGVLTNSLLILLTVIFMLLEAAGFPNKLRAASSDADKYLDSLGQVAIGINRYLAIKTWISLLTGAMVGLWLFFLGVDFPGLWGLVAFLLNYVPNIGSIFAAVPGVLTALVQLGALKAGYAAAGYIGINLLVGSVIEPRFMGRGLGMSTLVVFLSLVFWGWVLGPVGMLLSVPLTMILRIALQGNEGTRWIAVLLGPEISKEAKDPEKPAKEKLPSDEDGQEAKSQQARKKG